MLYKLQIELWEKIPDLDLTAENIIGIWWDTLQDGATSVMRL